MNKYRRKERRVGPELHTHMASAIDLEKTTVRQSPEIIKEAEQGPGAFDHRNNRDDE